jgi:hypothetical protein
MYRRKTQEEYENQHPVLIIIEIALMCGHIACWFVLSACLGVLITLNKK